MNHAHLTCAAMLLAIVACKSEDERAVEQLADQFVGSAAAGAHDRVYELSERKFDRFDCGCGDLGGKGCGSRDCTPEERTAAIDRVASDIETSCPMLRTLGDREVDSVSVSEPRHCLGGMDGCATVQYVGTIPFSVELSKHAGTWYVRELRSYDPAAPCQLSL